MCSDIEPDTSIRQNMTAWDAGLPNRIEAAVANIDRIDEGDPAGLRLQRLDLGPQFVTALLGARLVGGLGLQ
jgi:hypothetical protein